MHKIAIDESMQGISAKSTRLLGVLRREFPGFPKTRERALPRLLYLVFAFIAFAIFMWIHPFLRALGFETVWFQFAGAALLWWESNAVENIDLVVEEFRLIVPRCETRGERVIRIVGNIVGTLIWIMAFIFVVSAFWMLSLKDDFYNRSINFLKVFLGLFLMVAATYASAKWVDRQFVKTALAIDKADAQGKSKEAQQQIARRMLRTIGFALVAIGTLLQIPSIAAQG